MWVKLAYTSKWKTQVHSVDEMICEKEWKEKITWCGDDIGVERPHIT